MPDRWYIEDIVRSMISNKAESYEISSLKEEISNLRYEVNSLRNKCNELENRQIIQDAVVNLIGI